MFIRLRAAALITVVDGAGKAYVADPGNDTLRKITPAGVVTTIARRNGSAGFTPGALPGALSKPVAVAIFGTTLYATCDSHRSNHERPLRSLLTRVANADASASCTAEQ